MRFVFSNKIQDVSGASGGKEAETSGDAVTNEYGWFAAGDPAPSTTNTAAACATSSSIQQRKDGRYFRTNLCAALI